jgi:hypothetical protein
MRVAPSCRFDDDPRALRRPIAERMHVEEVRFLDNRWTNTTTGSARRGPMQKAPQIISADHIEPLKSQRFAPHRRFR